MTKKIGKVFIFVILTFSLVLVTCFYSPVNLKKYSLENQINNTDSNDSLLQSEELRSSLETSWIPNGILICNANYYQRDLQICSDGQGGAIIVWEDARTGTNWDIYAQRISSTGQLLWGDNGTAICSASKDQYDPQICSDEEGGTIITWCDDRSGDGDIYAQKINSTGQVQWLEGGRVICEAIYYQGSPQICSDGDGGAIITWTDYRNPVGFMQADIYAQKINSTGDIKWTIDGIPICIAEDDQEYPQICSDDEGGTILTWFDDRSGNKDIYAQKINSTGAVKWADNGISICIMHSGVEYFDTPQMINDGSGGAIIAWDDNRGISLDIYAQKIDSNGQIKWMTNGIEICTSDYHQSHPKLCYDQTGGAIITWYDFRSSSNNDIYAQKVNSNGNIEWINNGVAVCTANGNQIDPEIISDGAGGAIIIWYDNGDIYAQRINNNGIIQWLTEGIAICMAINDQSYPKICIDGYGGAIIAWEDERNDESYIDIYAQRIKNSLPTSTHPNDIITYGDSSETIEWTLTDDIGEGQYRVLVNNSIGNYYVWNDWTPWINNSVISIPINRSSPGIYNYTIEFYDDQNQFGIPDTVFVTILDKIPISDHPDDIKTAPGRSEIIQWILTDDFAGGQYRVIANNSVGNNYVWNDWTPWINNSVISIPINRTKLGSYNYTIEFYDNNFQLGNPDTVIVDILDPTYFPKILINLPKPNQIFGNSTFNYNLTIIEDNLDKSWYTLDDALTKYFFTETSGTIDQTAWDNCDDGAISIKFYANNTESYIDCKEVIVFKDGKAPDIKINSPKSGQFFGNSTFNFDLTIIEPNLNKTWYVLNDQITQYFFTGISGTIDQIAWDNCDDGAVSIKFYANSSLGNIAFKEVIVNKDTIIPQIIINSPAPTQFYGNLAFEFNLTVIEPNLNMSWYILNNETTQYFFTGLSGTIDQTAWDNYEDGIIVIRFYVNDSAGNSAFEEVNIIKYTHIPEIIINSPRPSEYYGDFAPTFSLSIDEPYLNTTWYSLNGGTNYTFTGLTGALNQPVWDACAAGLVTIRFYANNTVGNMGFKEVVVFKNMNLTIKNAYAIVIGIELYQYLSELYFCEDDVSDIYSYLRFGCNIKSENIILLFNTGATHSDIDSAFSQIRSKIGPDDVFFFFFSGHGGESGGSHLICPYDCHPSVPSSNYYDTELAAQLNSLNCAEYYVVIDACHSGGMIPESQTSGRYIMTACADWEVSIEHPELQNGVLTYYFMESFFQASDTNSDGVISLEEQFSYLSPRVISYSAGEENSQHPQKYDGISGQTVLYPSLGSLVFTPSGNQLYYSFYLYGNGKIETLNLTVCSVTSSIILKTEDIRFNTPSNHGFGYYSGVIELEGAEDITSYEILVDIEGYGLVRIKSSYGDTDGDGLTDLFEIFEGNGIDPTLNDTDFDGLSDYDEYYGITDPLINDTDGDGILDGYELLNGLNPLTDDANLDLDNDGLTNLLEFQIGTFANNPDSDTDQMPDGWEYNNGLNYTVNDANLDPDNDFLLNLHEYTNNTDPYIDDCDSDGLLDGIEVIDHGTNPLLSDTDSDGLSDGDEINTYNTNPLLSDTDSDGMPDGWEVNNLLDPLIDDSALDPDEDDLENLQEYQEGTNPNNPDTDGDGWLDGEEVLTYNTDPLDPNDYPTFPEEGIPGYEPILILFAIALFIPLLSRKVTKLYKKTKVVNNQSSK